eukprot:Rhum_TRINITY_DN14790_c12_g2::Rhum_TRINITY_DN14790_c12_g2_i1::g.118099::m.118099
MSAEEAAKTAQQQAQQQAREDAMRKGIDMMNEWLTKKEQSRGAAHARLVQSIEDDYELVVEEDDRPGDEGVLGRGMYGIVRRYRRRPTATHLPSTIPPEVLAIKAIKKTHACTTYTNAKHVMVEIEVLRHIRHENIVRLYEVCHDEEYVYMVMEMCKGEELFDLLRKAKGPLEPDVAAVILKQILLALHYIHSNHVVHRDIKVENVIVDPTDHHIKIVDFGIAKYCGPAGQGIGQDLPQSPAPGTVAVPGGHQPPSPLVCSTPGAGTHLYMALESLNGFLNMLNEPGSKAKWMSSRSQLPKLDVYSAGVTGYVMLVGKLPYKSGYKDPQKRLSHLSGEQTRGFPVHGSHAGLAVEALECIRDLMNADSKARPSAIDATNLDWLKGVAVPTRAKLPEGVAKVVELKSRPEGGPMFMITRAPKKKSKQPPKGTPVPDAVSEASVSRSSTEQTPPPPCSPSAVSDPPQIASVTVVDGVEPRVTKPPVAKSLVPIEFVDEDNDEPAATPITDANFTKGWVEFMSDVRFNEDDDNEGADLPAATAKEQK